MMGYETFMTMTILRTEHRVTFVESAEYGTLAEWLKRDLAHVPDHARLIEVQHDGDTTKLIFREDVPAQVTGYETYRDVIGQDQPPPPSSTTPPPPPLGA